MKAAILRFSLLLGLPAAMAASDSTAFCGLRLGLTRDQILTRVEQEPPLRGVEVVKDSNTLILISPSAGNAGCDGNRLVSVKCLFNKKKTVQALSFTFAAATTDAVDAAYRWARIRLGEPVEPAPKTAGFSSEAEWTARGTRAFFFASDVDFEAYLLLGTAAFVKEEDLRGSRPQE